MTRLKIIVYIFACLSFISVKAQSLQGSADSAYTAGNFEEAAKLYETEIKENGSSAGLYYNLGNCHYRLGKYAKAVLDYERSLRLDPTNEKTRANLALLNTKLVDKKGFEGSFFSRTFDDITNLFSSNGWAWLGLILFLFTIAAAALYLFSSGVLLRKIGFFGGGTTLVLCCLSIIFAINANGLSTSKSDAVVITPSSILSTAPRAPQNRNEEAMLLHEGAKIKILDSVASPTDSIKTMWYDASFDNEHRAWISSSDVEII